jgi:hypothetical protein
VNAGVNTAVNIGWSLCFARGSLERMTVELMTLLMPELIIERQTLRSLNVP